MDFLAIVIGVIGVIGNVLVLLPFLVYLIRKYIAYLNLERNKIAIEKIKFTRVDLVVAIIFILISCSSFITIPVGLIVSIPFLLKRNKIYKTYGGEIGKQKEEKEKQDRQKEIEKNELTRKKEELREKMLVEQNSLRIIGKIAILLVVLGFFMPITSIPLLGSQNGFEFAEFATNMGNAVSAFQGIEDAEKKGAGLSTSLYLCFISALIGGLFIIPLVMKKRIHILFDLVFILVSGVCWFFAYLSVRDFEIWNIQIGGYFIFVGLIASFLIFLFVASKITTGNIPLSNIKETGETKKCVKCGQRISADLFVCPNCRGEEFN